MLLRLCQLKSLPLLVLLLWGGCSFLSPEKESADLALPIESKWFSPDAENSLVDRDGNSLPHLFYDVDQDKEELSTLVNSVIITHMSSSNHYEFDLFSGQRYFSHAYCPQKDVWNQYSSTINKPNFSIGIIPGHLDQVGEPLRVILFGGTNKYRIGKVFFEKKVRLVGAFIEQRCLEGDCLVSNTWKSRLVFVGVDPLSTKLESVTDVAGLKSKINWSKSKAILENMEGRDMGAGSHNPYIRIGQLLPLEDALSYHKKHSIFITGGEARKIQKTCHKMYNKFWKLVGQERDEDRPARNITELKAKAKLIDTLKKKKKAIGFSARLKTFITKYQNEFQTCQKFVYAGNVNKDSDKFWFLNYMAIYFRLHHEGYHFDCRNRSWQKNKYDSLGRPLYDLKKGIESCKDGDYDFAMNFLPNFLKSLVNSESTYFKFVDYDNHAFGTHQKLYSWVKVSARKFDCSSDSNVEIRKQLKLFPEDSNWKPRDVKDMEDEMKIIY